ncbi:MAG: DMT family transporter [Caballeronia sp.]
MRQTAGAIRGPRASVTTPAEADTEVVRGEGVLSDIQPFFVIGLGAWWLGERVSKAQVIACVVALAGLVLASGLIGSKTSLIATSSYQTGVALCLVGAVAYAGFPFIARKAKRVSSFALSWWQSAVGVLLTAWWPLWHGLPQTTTAWLWLAGLGSIHRLRLCDQQVLRVRMYWIDQCIEFSARDH